MSKTSDTSKCQPLVPDKEGVTRFRSRQEHGVKEFAGVPTIVFVTVCTRNRVATLANREVVTVLHDVWSTAEAWRVGHYVVMPDHIHLFACPGTPSLSLDAWIRYWKSHVTKKLTPSWRWQTDHWDRRMRTRAQYTDRCEYMFYNPVRHKLTKTLEEWPWRGMVYDIDW